MDSQMDPDQKHLGANNPPSMSSGNSQLSTVDIQASTENLDTFAFESPCSTSTIKCEPSFPIPAVKLGSNDVPGSEANRLINSGAPRISRPKILVDPERPYLSHPKYLEYLSRPRQDLGADGKPIWNDVVETAFQNALVHIKPMGRRKCSQRGRPHGRNMLIAEWILRETGEVRLRKQVSSHIQVLSSFLKGIPEWDRVTKASSDKPGTLDGRRFYHDSIEHMVNKQKLLRSTSEPSSSFCGLRSTESDEGRNLTAYLDHLEKFGLERLSFEMWVSLPNHWERPLHNYTRLQIVDRVSAARPLDSIKSWQISYPQLQALVDDRTQYCELLLVESSFRLMDDFPPPCSKLGISLELDFLGNSPMKDVKKRYATLKRLRDWTCVTSMYRDGVPIKEPVEDKCRLSGTGKVQPFFESKWWASTFTSLTESRKLAEDSNDPAVVESAKEESQHFFQSFTVMQEIFAVQEKDLDVMSNWCDTPPVRERMAILLWKFSQAPDGSAGTTTWQSLIPPPDRLGTTIPMPLGSETELPPLAMDSLMEASPGANLFDDSHNIFSKGNSSYNIFSPHPNEDLYQSGFMQFQPEQQSALGDGSFRMETGRVFRQIDEPESPQGDHSGALQLSRSVPASGLPQSPGGQIFTIPAFSQCESTMSLLTPAFHDQFGGNNERPHSLPSLPDHALHRFDITTHEVLQQQLHAHQPNAREGSRLSVPQYSPMGDVPVFEEAQAEPQLKDLSWDHIDESDEALQAALLAATTMNDLSGGQQAASNSLLESQHGQLDSHTSFHHASLPYLDPPPPWSSPVTFRPNLISHHSFPGANPDLLGHGLVKQKY